MKKPVFLCTAFFLFTLNVLCEQTPLTAQQIDSLVEKVLTTFDVPENSYLGVSGIDRVKQMHDRVVKGDAEAKKITSDIWAAIEKEQKSATTKPDLANFTGTFTDQWFGDIEISIKNGKPYFASKRSLKLAGEMMYYKANTFVVKWNDRSLDADAFVQFNLDNTGKAESIKMNAISPMTDFSFDFQDLDFRRK